MSNPFKPLPEATPETKPFWEATQKDELHIQQCNDCASHYFPPRPFCPSCGSRNVAWKKASGKATLFSYVINPLKNPSYDGPYSIAVVQLEEGPRMMSNIVNCDQTPEALILDMPLEVTFERMSDDINLPQFQPAKQ